MPLVDAYGRPLHPGRAKKPIVGKRPKNRKRAPRVPKIKAEGPPRHVLPRTIELQARHSINGEQYGPGRVTVLGAIAQVLLEQDQRAALADQRVAGERACVIGPGPGGHLRVRQVSPDYFMTQPSGDPIATISGRSGAAAGYSGF